MHTVAIIGAGFSGSLTAAHLLRAPGPRRILLVDRTSRFARGVAYSTRCPAHVLNVPAGRMSAFEDDPDHFLRWAKDRNAATVGGSFLPRMLYGEYLEWTLDQAERAAPPGVGLERIAAAAVHIDPVSRRLTLSDGRILTPDHTVLALGNFPPRDPPIASPRFYSSSRYIRDPWAADRLGVITPDEPLLLIGTGLTMIDIALEIAERGHRGPIFAMSRRGLLPQPHRSPAKPHHPAPPTDLDSWRPTALGYLRALRREIERSARRGIDWREVVTSIRHDTPRLWNALSEPERRRFLLRLRAFWEVHRHRAAPQATAAITALLRSGRLKIAAARLQDLREDGDAVRATILRRGGPVPETLSFSRVINCTGPDTDLARIDDPLIGSLRAAGAIVPDPLGLGARTDEHGALLDSRERPSPHLYLCGPLRKAQLWENTAVPELRIETATLAKRLLSTRLVHVTGPLAARSEAAGRI